MKNSQKKGYTVIESLVYMAVLVVMTLVIANMLLLIMRASTTVKINRNLNTSALVGLGRIEREIRSAKSVDIAGSTLGSSPGVLKLNTTDSSGNVTTIEFNVASNLLQVKKGAGTAVAVTPSQATVTSLVFRRFTTGKSEGVKVEVQFSTTVRGITQTENYYTTAVLRSSY
jgi:type II secretory pathway pseudopilin PulG